VADPSTTPSAPFATATVARIYLDQGKLDQAEQIFVQLLERRPGDEQLEEGLAEVRRRRDAQQTAQSSDAIDVQPADEGVSCRWQVSSAGRHRARLVAGNDGALTLRLACFPTQPDAEPVDTPLEADTGVLARPVTPKATLAAAAVGLLTGDGQFVAIAHSKIVALKS